jgi:hypothetical protein
MKFKGGRAEGKAAIIGLSCRLPKSDNLEVFNSTAEDFKVTTNKKKLELEHTDKKRDY